MNIFKFRDQLIDEYRSYVTSFIRISDPDINGFAEGCFSRGALWPEPLIQLNPTFKPGKTIDELTARFQSLATEHGWGREEFLENTAWKAGLPREAWKDPKAHIHRFAAEIIEERHVATR